MTCFPRSAHEGQANSEEAGWGGGFKGLKVETDEDIGGIVGEPVGAGRRDDLASDVEKRVEELGCERGGRKHTSVVRPAES